MSNVFSFTGTVGKDAEVRYTASGLAVLSVTVANNVGFGDRQQTLWVSVSLFGKRAEGSLKDYLKKGQQVFVSGELTLREYKTNDGSTRTSCDLNANILDLLGKRSDGGSQAGAYAAGGSTKSQPGSPPTSAYESLDLPYDDDVPF